MKSFLLYNNIIKYLHFKFNLSSFIRSYRERNETTLIKKIYIYILRATFFCKFRSVPTWTRLLIFSCTRLDTKMISWLSFALVQKCCVSPFANPAHFSPVCTETGLHLIPASRSNDAFQRAPLLTLLSLVYSSLSRFALFFQDHASFLSPSFLPSFIFCRTCLYAWFERLWKNGR